MRINGLRTFEVWIIQFDIVQIENGRAHSFAHPCEVVHNRLRRKGRAVMKAYPMPQMEHPYTAVILHLPRFRKARRRFTGLLIDRDERLPHIENAAAVEPVLLPRSEVAVRRQHDRIVCGSARLSGPLLTALSAARKCEHENEQN